MHVALANALGQVALEAGKTYHCQVGKLSVEVRVKAPAPAAVPMPLAPADQMLDPWVDLPAPPPLAVVQAVAAPPMLPDAPYIS